MQANSQIPTHAYRQFPLSIRLAQRSWSIVVIPLLIAGKLGFRNNPFASFLVAVAGCCALVGYCATCYAIIRYPFMGIIDAADGDLYARHIEKKVSKFLLNLLGVLLLFGIGFSLFASISDGKISPPEAIWWVYGGITWVFLLFLRVRYHRIDHPTISILLRCTLGFATILFPLFLWAVIIGSLRARRLLDDESPDRSN